MSGQGRAFFITGTDTDVGKTRVACALLEKARSLGLSTAAVKPIAAGADLTEGKWRNDDVVALAAHCSVKLGYQEINPVCFQTAMAPHLAAIKEGRCITLWELKNACNEVLEKGADVTLIEGAGGWMVPVNDRELMSDLPRVLNVPVILIVGMRLGCLNHALLTVKAIEQSGVTLAGWVANHIDPHMQEAEANILTLKQQIRVPLLGVIPWVESPKSEVLAQYFNALEVQKLFGVNGSEKLNPR